MRMPMPGSPGWPASRSFLAELVQAPRQQELRELSEVAGGASALRGAGSDGRRTPLCAEHSQVASR